MRIGVAEIRTVRTESAAAAVAPAATAVTVLAAITLFVTILSTLIGVLSGILLRLAAACNECRQAGRFRHTVVATLARRLRMGLLRTRLMLWAAVLRLIARRERLRIARQIRLRLRRRRLWRVAWLVLTEERLAIVIAVIVVVVSRALRGALLRRWIVVIGILLAELFLRGGYQAEIVFGVLVVIFGRYAVAGGCRVTRESQVFLVHLKRVAANSDAWSVAIEHIRSIATPATVAAAARAF